MSDLARELLRIRSLRQLSLRDVEKKSHRQISSSYLSQVETGKIENPSPRFLFVLSQIYDVDYPRLMELAGYLRREQGRSGNIAAFNIDRDLTPEEIEQLKTFIEFLKSRRKQRSEHDTRSQATRSR